MNSLVLLCLNHHLEAPVIIFAGMMDWSKAWQKARERKAAVLAMGLLLAALVGFAVTGTDWAQAWGKLLDKRVDIAANALSGFLVALIAVGSWWIQQQWQRSLNLKHEREDKERHSKEDRITELNRRGIMIKRMTDARERHASEVAACGSAAEVHRSLERTMAWLKKDDLLEFPENSGIVARWTAPDPNGDAIPLLDRLRIAAQQGMGSDPVLPARWAMLPDEVRSVRLPEDDNDLFRWPELAPHQTRLMLREAVGLPVRQRWHKWPVQAALDKNPGLLLLHRFWFWPLLIRELPEVFDHQSHFLF